MARTDLLSTGFTPEEVDTITQAIATVEQTIANKVVNLTPEERRQYGRLGDRTDNWIKKAGAYMDQKPELVPFYLNKAEFDKDLKAREDIIPILRRLASVTESLEDTAKLLSTDIYNGAIAYYRNIKIISQQNVPGTSSIYEDLSNQFPGRGSAVPEENQNTTNSSDTDTSTDTTL